MLFTNTMRFATVAGSLSLSTLVPSATAAQDSAQDPRIEQADATTRETSTAKITRDGSAVGKLEQVDAIELFYGESIEPDPAAGIYQRGRGATARIALSGTGNAAAIRQADSVGDGADGSSAVIVFGNDSAVANHGTAYIDQQGDKSSVDIQQQGDANFSVGIVRANENGEATGAEQSHTLIGHDHRSEIVQTAEAAIADVTLTQGGESTGLVRQDQAGSKASIAIKNGPASQARIVQAGGGRASAADIDVDGGANRSTVSQAGGHEATLSQTGAHSEITVAQDGGRGNIAAVNQAGREGSAVVRQNRSGRNKAQIDQEGSASRSLRATIEQQGAGGGSEADIDQTGQTHIAVIRQDGSGGGSVAGIDQSTDGASQNEALVEQTIDARSGTDTVDIDQGGSANEATVRQQRSSGGTGSTGSVAQPGARGQASIVQQGPALKGQIDQNGNTNESRISQTGAGPSSEASIKTGSGTDDNLAEIEQRSGGTIASIDQTSPNNRAAVTQTNAKPSAGTVEADIDQGGGVQNRATIEQGGAGTVRAASLAQTGRENDGRIRQSGAANGIAATVQMGGDGNRARLRQVAQDGGSLQAELKQQGDANVLVYEQRGSQMGASLSQDGNGNRIEVTQSGSGYDVSITQNGDNNSFKISYSGPAEGGGGFSIVQQGGEKRDAQ